MKYAINFQETIEKTFVVEANSLDDAIRMVGNAANSEEFSIGNVKIANRDIRPSTLFKDGIIPEDEDMSGYDKLEPIILNTDITLFTLTEDEKVSRVSTKCKVNVLTKEVFDVEGYSIEDLKSVDGINLTIDIFLYEVFPKSKAEADDYWFND